ncbi:MAG: circadian clock kinase KaiC [Deltaproteobacteria bacterium]|jgi:circadian clock protein KaiC|nr:circadian clock kinase KaiC [Deltaproteobacteria bacterium]MBP1716693.1 circadian clock kinase KaiC [Deltaproteobacteria bacterium]
MAKGNGKFSQASLPKTPTGIPGLDEITGGGLPQGRPTLICGSAGCGKTLLAMHFLVQGVLQYHEPGVFMTFEENAEELKKNFASLGFDLNGLSARKKVLLDHVFIERSEIEETGEYDLEGLFIRLGHAIDSIGAKRVVLDTIEALFSGLSSTSILRAELRRLFRWLKGKGVTAIVTGERGEGTLTRHGLEEYVADCVILLDHRVAEQISTRRLRIVKYRGTSHGTNEYPFLIDEKGVSVLPITSLRLDHSVSSERISSGISRLDAMLGGKGCYRGSSILISGTAGTGKTSLGATFAQAACRRGERCLYFAFEESRNQIIRNMRSIGLNLGPWVKKGLLHFHSVRPTTFGLEMHLALIHKEVESFKPQVVIFDPITNLLSISAENEIRSLLTRVIDYLKMKQITTLFTSLTTAAAAGLEQTNIGISSLMDTWLFLRDVEDNGERNRGLYVLKSRGMAHSNQIREFVITGKGIQLTDVYLQPGALLMGTARLQKEAQEKAAARLRREEINRRERELKLKSKTLEGQIAALQIELEAQKAEERKFQEQERQFQEMNVRERMNLARMRGPV